jgi:DNA-binding transcriptional LysR family regulator
MSDGDRFSGIEAFVSSAKHASFTDAAEELRMTPSGVAKAVTRLEARVGLKLLHRTTRRLTLTSEGEAYLTTCREIIHQLDDLEMGLSPKDTAPQGRVRIELPAAFGRRHILPSLLAMANEYPRLDLMVSFSERTIDLVEEQFDLAVRIGTLASDHNLVAKRLGTQRLVLCASADYLARHGQVLSVEELSRRDCITGPRRNPKVTWLLRGKDGKPIRLEIEPRHEFSDGEAMLQAGLAGCGIMQMPTWLVGDAIADGRLVSLLDEHAGEEMPIHAVWPKSHYVQPKVRAIVDRLAMLAANTASGFVP